MASKRRTSAAVEWITGIIPFPGDVGGEGEIDRSKVLLWLDKDGIILGMDTAPAGVLSQRIHQHFRDITQRLSGGGARAPTRIRVASPELAETLRAGLGKAVEVVCAPTPELDDAAAALRERMREDEEREAAIYLPPGVSADAMAAFFRAAAGLFRAKPWSIVPGDEKLLSITVEMLGIHDTVLAIIGQAGKAFGLILFSDLDAYEAFSNIDTAIEDGEDPDEPPSFAITFNTRDQVAPAALDEIAEHGWEIAGPTAYPWLVVVDESGEGRAPNAEELTLAEVVALALPQVLSEERTLLDAWQVGEEFSRTLTVASYHAGEVDVTMHALHEEQPVALDESVPVDLMRAFAELPSDGDELDSEARETLEDALLDRFAASPEAEPLDNLSSSGRVLRYAAEHFGATIATLTPAHLREIVFVILPRTLTIKASAAGGIIDELRAFFAFMKREFGLAQADNLLAVLGGDATPWLTRALSDPRNFGMAKSIMMAGWDAGFDMDTQKGVEAWMREVEGKPLPRSIQLPSITAPPPRAADPEAERARKNKRKAEKKARKKNR